MSDDDSAAVVVVVDDAVANTWKSSSPEIPQNSAAVENPAGFAADEDAYRNARVFDKTRFPLEKCWISLKLDFLHVD